MLGKKSFILTLFVVFSFSVLGGALFYKHSIQQNSYESNPIQNHIGDLRFQFKDFEEVSPLQHPTEVARSGEASATAPSVPKSSPRAANNEVKANVQQQPSSGEGSSLRSQIEQKYISRLQSLASGYEGKLNGLISAAMNEYNSAQKANPNADISPLINKYFSAGKALEAECDSQFYSILAAFEGELRANSFPLDMAVKARETYEARKNARAGQVTAGKP